MAMSQGAFREMHACNADSYVQSFVSDMREAVCQVDYPPSEVTLFYMIKYVETGVFVVIFRTIPPVAGNHLASWIYLPYTAQVSNKEVYDAVTLIGQKVMGSQVSGKDLSEINAFFDREYPSSPVAPIFPPGDPRGSVAYRYYGAGAGVSLQELIGPYRYQVPYLPFSAVLLVDQAAVAEVLGTNLTSVPLEAMAVLLPPSAPERGGYRPVLYDQRFDVPFYVPMGQNADVIWESDSSAHDIKQSVYVAQPQMQAPSLGQPNRQPSGHAAEPAASPASAQGDVPTRKKTYHFQIPAKSAAIGTVIEFEITTNAELDSSPIDGYEPTADIQEGAGRSNHLLYKADSFKQKLLNNGMYVLAGFVVGILVALLATCDRGAKAEPAPTGQNVAIEAAVAEPQAAVQAPAPSSSPAQENASQQPSASPESNASDYSLEAAIRYLDSNDTWSKEDMEKYPDLSGLYDDLNQVRRQAIVEKWGPKLKESRVFTNNIVKHSRQSYKKTARHVPHNKPEEPQLIRIQNYLNNIDP